MFNWEHNSTEINEEKVLRAQLLFCFVVVNKFHTLSTHTHRHTDTQITPYNIIMQQKNDKNRKMQKIHGAQYKCRTKLRAAIHFAREQWWVRACVCMFVEEVCGEQFKTKWMLERNKLMVKYSEHTLKVFFTLCYYWKCVVRNLSFFSSFSWLLWLAREDGRPRQWMNEMVYRNGEKKSVVD